MGVKDGKYTIFTMLKERVLDVSVEDVNKHTDKVVSYTIHRLRRRVEGITLTIDDNKEKALPDDPQQAIIKKLEEFKLKKIKIKQLLKKHHEHYLRANIKIVEEKYQKGEIRNLTGYLLTAFEKDFRHQETEHERIQKEKEEARKKEQEAKDAAIKVDKAKRQQFKKRKANLVKERLEHFSADEYEKAFVSFEEHINNNPMFSIMYDSKGFENAVIQSEWFKFLEPKLLTEEQRDFDKFEKERKVLLNQ